MKLSASSLLRPRSLRGSASSLRILNQTSRSTGASGSASSNDVSSAQKSSGATLQASRATSAARIADSALSEILSIRKQQQSYASLAESSNVDERRQELQTAITELDTEVTRIKDSALDAAGNNVLEGVTYVVDENKLVSLGDFSALGSSSGVDVSTVAGASASKSTFVSLVNSVVSATEASTSASTKAETVLADITAVDSTSRSGSGAVSSIDEAEQLSKTIATELKSVTNGVEISLLTSDSVSRLLS